MGSVLPFRFCCIFEHCLALSCVVANRLRVAAQVLDRSRSGVSTPIGTEGNYRAGKKKSELSLAGGSGAQRQVKAAKSKTKASIGFDAGEVTITCFGPHRAITRFAASALATFPSVLLDSPD